MNTLHSSPKTGRRQAAATRPLDPSALPLPKLQPAPPHADLPATRPARRAPAPAGKPLTVVKAKIDVGFGNALFIRGQGDGLCWEKGQPLSCIDAETWVWSTARARDQVVFKLLLNDQVWAQGEDLVAQAGKQLELTPSF